MEDNHHFSSETPSINSISTDHMSLSYDFGYPMGSYDHHDFCDLLPFDEGFADNVLSSATKSTSDLKPGMQGNGDGDAEHNEEGNSSRMTEQGTEKAKRDRSKTLVTERRRRSRMKERLYELRSLVPNITKMDKTSIVGDAVVYVQSLKTQAKELTEEIALLESSSKEDQLSGAPLENVGCNNNLYGGKVLEVMTHKVGEARFSIKVECYNGDGMAHSLYSAIEFLDCFHIESSNLSTNLDRIVLTLTVNTKGFEEVITASAIKLWVMGALLKEGFGFDTLKFQ